MTASSCNVTRLSVTVITLALLIVISGVRADDDEPFVITQASFKLNDSMLVLDLRSKSNLPEFITMAVDQGFAVPLMYEIEIRSEQSYWFDPREVSLKQSYLLHYQPLLDSYVVLDVNTGERHYFDRRKAAVQFIELVYNYPMLDIDNLAADKNYYARARYGIDADKLPLPLQSSWFWDSDWDLQSEWYEWEVERPAS